MDRARASGSKAATGRTPFFRAAPAAEMPACPNRSAPAGTVMPKITYVEPDGERIEAEGEVGSTVMETAIMNGVPGIVAECGGACSCATCHVYVDPDWADVVGGPSPMEEDMLDFAFDVRETSRLSCQIKVRDEIDGLVVHVPTRQG
jgi:2Fe-2S ferredoxin